MLTSTKCFRVLGDPVKETHMTVWDVPQELRFGPVPKRIYCGRHLVPVLTKAFQNIIQRGLVAEVKTWNGCFNIRPKRDATSMSLHSWGLAIDINAAENAFGAKPKMSPELVKCFTDAGMDWGGTWSKPDGMHFQLRDLPV